MSNTNTNLQTQTSNALHNAIMEAGGKDRPPMLALGNYVQWKSRIKRYIDSKHNNELIHYCLQNPPYKFKWNVKTVPITEGSSETTTEGYMENYKNVSQDIRDQLNAEAEAVQIILTWIDNDIYSIVDVCPNACEMWKVIERLKQGESINSQELKTVSYHKVYDILKQHQNEVNEIRAERLTRTDNPLALVAQQQLVYHPNHYTQNSSTKSQQAATRNRGKAIVNSPPPTYDQKPEMVAEDDALSKEKEIDKLMALISLSFKKIYKRTNNNLRTSSNTSRANQENSPRINRGIQVVQQSGIQCYNCKEYRHVARECQKPKRIQEVTPDVADNSGPIFNTEPLHKVHNDNDNYNVFANDREHLEQPESVNDTYLEEQGDTNITIDSLDMSTNRETVDQDDDDLAREHDLLASLIEKLKYEIDDSKNCKNFLESSNKALVGKLKDLKKFQAELDRYHDVNYASKINNLNQTILEMKKELFAHQETISIMSQEKEAQIKFYKTREDKEIEKVIALENKFLKKAQRANPRLYDIGCYNDNLALMLAPGSDEMIRLAQESRSKLSDLIRPFDYKNLNNLYDLFVPQREKSSEQRYFSEREYYYADHMNAILGVYTTLNEFTDLQCDYLDQVVKCECLEKELSKSKTMSKSVGIKSLLEVTAVKLVLLVQKFILLVLKVNVVGIKVTTAERLQLMKG
ncbi:gag-pol polyprotein [Tanacetum coccineum]